MFNGLDEGKYIVYGISPEMQKVIKEAFDDLNTGKYTISQIAESILAADSLDIDEGNLALFEFGRLYERRRQCVR